MALLEIGVQPFNAAAALSFCSFLIMLSIQFGGFMAEKFHCTQLSFFTNFIAIISLLLLSLGIFWAALIFLFGAFGMFAGGIIIALSGGQYLQIVEHLDCVFSKRIFLFCSCVFNISWMVLSLRGK